ncbi:hypothetical protein Adi01nite_33070 [Amorphoplanes digitatis]|nr:hypothetical protein Adi01nite_33070 [Actinoplanes digitatis]
MEVHACAVSTDTKVGQRLGLRSRVRSDLSWWSEQQILRAALSVSAGTDAPWDAAQVPPPSASRRDFRRKRRGMGARVLVQDGPFGTDRLRGCGVLLEVTDAGDANKHTWR